MATIYSSEAALQLRNGLQMPAIGLGTSVFGSTWQSKPDEVRDAILCALETGFRHIDCAYNYGNEHVIGGAVREAIRRGIVRREDVWITSKCPPNHFGTTEDVEEALAKSLADLQLEYLDLYLLHFPITHRKGAAVPPARQEDIVGYSPEGILAVWRVLERAVDSGRVRSIGVSNFSIKKLDRLIADARIPPVVNQVEMHPYLSQRELRDWCAHHGVTVTAFAPLGSPGRVVPAGKEDVPLLQHPTVTSIATTKTATPAQVLLAWSRQRGAVPLPKSVNPSRLAENIKSLDVRLSEEELAAVDALDKGARFFQFERFRPEGMGVAELFDE